MKTDILEAVGINLLCIHAIIKLQIQISYKELAIYKATSRTISNFMILTIRLLHYSNPQLKKMDGMLCSGMKIFFGQRKIVHTTSNLT
jgi:hypothetical protein